jgi:cytochrome c oxidase assembly protein subunit 15
MAVPDWPSTYGYNLFLYPWETWFFGPWKLFVEHGHRLLGSFVGLVAIALLAIAIRTRAPRGYVVGAAAMLVFVCLQGLLGGARVLLESNGILDGRSIALLHGVTGPAFFTYAVLYTAACHPSFLRSVEPRIQRLGAVKTGSLVLAILSMIQLVLGANLRHVPDAAEPNFFKIITLLHLVFAAALLVQTLILSSRILGDAAIRKEFASTGTLLLLLLVVQIGLGVGTWVLKYGYPPNLPFAAYFAQLTIEHRSLAQILTVTAHVANGSLVLALSARLAFVSRRYATMTMPITGPVAAALLAEGLA